MDIIIRQAKQEDWNIIQKLNNELFIDNSVYDRHLDLTYPFSRIGISHFKKASSSPKFCCLIAFAHDKPIGYLLGGPKKLPYRKIKIAEIIELGVSSEYRSGGIGTSLVNEFRSWCKTRDYEMLMVSSYFDNNRAVSFYKKQGFSPIDIALEMKI